MGPTTGRQARAIHSGGREELEARIEKLRIAEEKRSRTEETELEEIKLRKRIQEELKIEEARVKMRADLERKTRKEERKDEKPGVKVKIEITKFKGNHLDWTHFWSQFETEVDRSSLSPVAKFSYLKEFRGTKPRSMIEGLPFTSDSYNRAKSIPARKYGKPSEVSNAHIQSVMGLPLKTPIHTRSMTFTNVLLPTSTHLIRRVS